MRYAPRFLTPWQRIDRQVDDRASEAHAEIKRMVREAMPEPVYKPVPYNTDLLYLLQNAGMYTYQNGMQAMSEAQLYQRQLDQAYGMRQSDYFGLGGGLFGMFAR